MFGRGFGKIGFFLLIAFTLVVSTTNTWKFVTEFLPADPFWLRLGAFAFFEGGLVLWARQFKHDAENVYRMFISGFMTLMDLLAVLSATAYEIANDVHSLGFSLPPAIASWIPVSILLVMGGQTVALILHYFADPVFFARLQHMNITGTSPRDLRQYQLPPTMVAPDFQLSGPAQARALPHPKQAAAPVAPQVQPTGIRTRLGNLFARLGLGLQTGAADYTIATDAASNGAASSADAEGDAQDVAQDGQKGQIGQLDFVEKRMFESFLQASPSQQDKLLEMAYTRSTEEVTNYLKSRYPDYARYITGDRVRNVMAAYMAQAKDAQPAQDANEPQPQMQSSAPPRAASARKRPASRPASTTKVSSAKRSTGDTQVILASIEAARPGISDAELARLAGVSQSTVSRWRKQ